MLKPTAIRSRPEAQTARAPNFGASPAVGIIVIAMGSMYSADVSAEWPRTICRYCRTRKMNPKVREELHEDRDAACAQAPSGEDPRIEHR
jgi:hypothetical protein